MFSSFSYRKVCSSFFSKSQDLSFWSRTDAQMDVLEAKNEQFLQKLLKFTR